MNKLKGNQKIPKNPATQLARELGPQQKATNNTIAQLIQQLTNDERMCEPNGYIWVKLKEKLK